MPKNFVSYPTLLSSSNHKAFTLIEILVVIGIITILSALVITALNPAQLRRAARDTNRQKDAAIISGALEQYYADNNQYPNTSNMECLDTILRGTDVNCSDSGSPTGPVYLKTVPLSQSAPEIDVEYCYSRIDSQNFILCTPLEADFSTVINGSGTASPCTVQSPTGGSLGSQFGAYCITNPF